MSRYQFLSTVLDEDIAVLPHPRTLLLVEPCHVPGLREGAGRFLYLGDNFLAGCLVLRYSDTRQGDHEKCCHQNDKDFVLFHSHAPSPLDGGCPIGPENAASIHKSALVRYF